MNLLLVFEELAVLRDCHLLMPPSEEVVEIEPDSESGRDPVLRLILGPGLKTQDVSRLSCLATRILPEGVKIGTPSDHSWEGVSNLQSKFSELTVKL
jgi:hypothetical protein